MKISELWNNNLAFRFSLAFFVLMIWTLNIFGLPFYFTISIISFLLYIWWEEEINLFSEKYYLIEKILFTIIWVLVTILIILIFNKLLYI